MKRTKQWWASLTPEERSELWWLEYGDRHSGSGGGYYPDDCGECGSCGSPSLGGGLCCLCRGRLRKLIDKADHAMEQVWATHP
jgi:hypothetical protein